MTYSVLGIETQTGQRVEIPKTSRLEGLYIIGIPGTGKTGLIENLILQDIKQDMGVGLLDPHGDLIDAVLARLPDRRVKDVIYLDITDYRSPFGLNLFACSDLTNPIEVQKTVDQVMHIFERLFEITRTTPLIIQYLRNCTHTLIANPGYTMADIPLLLRNKECRRKLVANVTDPNVLGFWQSYEEDLKPREQREEREPILRRLEELLQPLTFNIVGQSTTTVDIRQVMDEGKILLIKLSAQLDSITSLIGSILIALILNAAYSRADSPVTKRRQFNLYADEFQRFATEDFSTILVEARKYGLATTIAHQTRFQPGMTDGIRATSLGAKNLVVFKINSKDADELAGEFDLTPQEAWEEEIEPIRFERVEEQVADEVEEDILEVTQDPVDYLITARGTHVSMRVREITQNLLVTLGNSSTKILINNLLVAVMDGIIHIKTDEFIDFMQKIAIPFANGRYIYEDSYILRFAKNREFIRTLVLSPVNWKNIVYWANSTQDSKREYLRNQVFSPINHEDPIHKFIDDEAIWVIKSRPYQGIHHGYHESPQTANLAEMTRKEKAAYFSTGYIEYGGIMRDAFDIRSFVVQITALAEELIQEPIRVPTGQKRLVPKMRTHLTYHTIPAKTITHPQRTYADMHNEVASQLTNLGNFVARVRYKNADERLVECTIRTLDPKQQPEKPLFGQALQARLASIKEQNIKDKYLRERSKIEEEIRQRQEQCSQPPEAEPPISRRPNR